MNTYVVNRIKVGSVLTFYLILRWKSESGLGALECERTRDVSGRDRRGRVMGVRGRENRAG